MKLGFTQVYNEVDWIGFAIDQAMKLCDKLLIVEGSQFVAFSDVPERSDDGTLDIIADKKNQYPKRIEVVNAIREHNNYRLNQCAIFNLGLTFCDRGDYFIQLDADEFYFDEWIAEANELMREGEVDLIKALNCDFAFGFKWRIEFGASQPNPLIVKKTERFHFVPTHKWVNPGENVIIISQVGRYHYSWVKPRKRILLRMRTSRRYSNMEGWFKKHWDDFVLEDGKEYPYFRGKFRLHRYEGEHPFILTNHPWRNVEDIRSIS